MNRRTWLPILSIVLLAACANPFGPRTRNPFGVSDPPGPPDDTVVQRFASQFELRGDDRDINANDWVLQATAGIRDSLDGDWYGRWSASAESVSIKTLGARVYILTREQGQPSWLIEAVRAGDGKLSGRWVNVRDPREHGQFVGKVVSPERIDGIWNQAGHRWDFRRRLK